MQSPYVLSIPFLKEVIEIDHLESLVTQILTQKRQDPTADTSALEAEVDQLVYGLYGLTEEEIKIIEST